MKPEIKKMWVDALRSGEYKQGPDVLKNDTENCFCCLGVLTDIYAKENGKTWDDIRENHGDEDLPREVREWSGIPQGNPHIRMNGFLQVISEWNDSENKTFVELADAIEEQF